MRNTQAKAALVAHEWLVRQKRGGKAGARTCVARRIIFGGAERRSCRFKCVAGGRAVDIAHLSRGSTSRAPSSKGQRSLTPPSRPSRMGRDTAGRRDRTTISPFNWQGLRSGDPAGTLSGTAAVIPAQGAHPTPRGREEQLHLRSLFDGNAPKPEHGLADGNVGFLEFSRILDRRRLPSTPK